MQRNTNERILLGLVTIGIFANVDHRNSQEEQLAKEAEKALKSEASAKQKHSNQPKQVKSHHHVHKHRNTGQAHEALLIQIK